MKSMASTSTSLINKNKQVLFSGNLERILSIYETKINTESDYIDKLTHTYQVSSESITVQNILYSLTPRFSTKKSNIISSYKPYISPKIEIDHVHEKSNVGFFTELVTASRYADTSDMIQRVKLNSENTSVVTTTKSGSNMYSDLTINYNTSGETISLLKDIKSGNNMYKGVISGIIGEVPYTTPGQLYAILNEPINLLELNDQRVTFIENKSFVPIDEQRIRSYINNIKTLDVMRDQNHIKYNLLIQEELYKVLSIPALKSINMSYYYGVLVKEYYVNPEFFRRLQPYINDRIFDNKKNATLFMARAAIIYHQTVKPILSNIEGTRKTNWEASFIDDMKDDIFT